MARLLVLLFLVAPSIAAQTWSQWGGGPRHTGSLPVYGQSLRESMADIVYDPFVGAARAEAGSLLVHYQTPLSDGNEVFMEVKSGSYTGFQTWETQTWNIRKFEWEHGQLVARWTAESDWDPVPSGSARFEPVFHGALANGFVYMPGLGGTVLEVNRTTGAIVRRLGLFAEHLDPTIYVTSPIAVSDDGILYYNTLKLPGVMPWVGNHEGAWLVKITPDGTAWRVSYDTLIPNAPAATAQCSWEFTADQLPWPPSPNAVAPTIVCGSTQNAKGFEWCVNAVAVDARGAVYINSEDGHLYALNQGGTLRERLFLQIALGAAYTPLSLGADGKIYTQNAGHLFVVGSNAPKRRATGK